MHQINDPSELVCQLDFSEPYVTGIFIRDDEGNLIQIYPGCEDSLTGNFEPDPEHSGFQIFVEYACYSH
jgi:hypothetical protein